LLSDPILDEFVSPLDGDPYVILENHLKNDIKVICPVRNVLGILASWNRLCDNDPENVYDKEVKKVIKSKVPMADKRARYFMEAVGDENGIKKRYSQYD